MTVTRGVHDEVELFGGPEAIFGCRHVPGPVTGHAGQAAGVLVCSSVGPGAAASYGSEARLGRALARAGIVAQRFHYRGTGSSDGAGDSLSFSALVADARDAVALLRERAHVGRIGFLGVRFGALVAARLACAVRDAPVALWAPVADPRRFLEEAVRARASGTRVGDEAAPAAGAAPRVDVHDVHDVPLAAELIDGAVVGSLADELGELPRHVLVVQTAAEPASADRYRALVERCRARHLRVEAVSLPSDRARDGALVPSADAGPLVDHTAGWLARRLLAPPFHTANGNGAT